ncbi:MAG: hypothetical protein U0797_09465 [Gemmataceae bacterium]
MTAKLDKALAAHQSELRGWVTLLHEDQSKVDDAVVGWAEARRSGPSPWACSRTPTTSNTGCTGTAPT